MTGSKAFRCSVCGNDFQVPASALAKYPGWTPRTCMACRDPKRGRRARPAAGSPGPELNLTLEEVLARFRAGPDTGIFTDGSANPNPGPGGWGVVYVVDGEVIDQLHGHEPHTTNNRMELTALIEAYKLAPASIDIDLWTDSDLCVKTVTQWAAGWEKRGWRRREGPIKNLELVQELYALAQAHPNVRLQWIKAHDGSLWNEYADSLSTAYTRARL